MINPYYNNVSDVTDARTARKAFKILCQFWGCDVSKVKMINGVPNNKAIIKNHNAVVWIRKNGKRWEIVK